VYQIYSSFFLGADWMQGNIAKTFAKPLTIHTYTAPEDGWVVNSHIVEFPTQLFVIDAQYKIKYAEEVAAYAANLAKPITRLYVTHFHPDHILGAAAFNMPVTALAEVKSKIEAVGDRVAEEEHAKHGDSVAGTCVKPTIAIAPGKETVDDITVDFLRVRGAETADALMIAFPGRGVLIAQDFLYNRVHVFVGEKSFDSWGAVLRDFQLNATAFRTLLPGHGAPAGVELYGEMLAYLSNAKRLFTSSLDAAIFKSRIVSAFPNYAGRVILDHEARFLYPPKTVAAS
jgi:glyoxylase-like metal-dependent hydrolase (beta-lactamase superfamily II)